MTQVVLLSGGLDSSTLLARAVIEQSGSVNVFALSVIYGQKHIKELRSAKLVANHYGVEHDIIHLPETIFAGGQSALVDTGPGSDMPQMQTYQELAEAEGPSPTVVPFRNATLISVATAYAINKYRKHKGDYPKPDPCMLWFGAHGEDARNWAYPRP
jgi:7-cyano-7-deazaguanine synthase